MPYTVNAGHWPAVEPGEPEPEPVAPARVGRPMVLPQPPKPYAGETATGRGLAVLLFVLAERVTATITELDLELAAHAVTLAGARADWRELPPVYLERVADAGRLIAGALRARAVVHPSAVTLGPAGVDRPNVGPGARLVAVPVGRPPAGGWADVEF